MKRLDELLHIYESVLLSTFVSMDEKGTLTFTPKNKTLDIKIKRDGKFKTLPFVMPIREILAERCQTASVKFHPMCENIFNGKSEVLNKLNVMMSDAICISLSQVIMNTLALKLDTADHATADNVAISAMSGLVLTKSAYTEIKKLFKSCTGAYGKYPLVSIQLSKETEKSSWTRQASIKLVDLDNDKVFGQILSDKASAALTRVVENIVGDINEYTSGTNIKTAPYFFSLLTAFSKIASRINEVNVGLGGKYRKEDVMIHDEWFDRMDNIPEVIAIFDDSLSTSYEGNTGLSKIDNSVEVIEVEPATSVSVKPKFRKRVKPEVVAPPQQEEHSETSETLQPSVKRYGGSSTVTATKIVNLKKKVEDNRTRGRVKTQPQLPQHCHAVDINGNALFYHNGDPFLIEGNQPETGLMISLNPHGNPMFDDEGSPVLIDPPRQQSGFQQQNNYQPNQPSGSSYSQMAANRQSHRQHNNHMGGGFQKQNHGYNNNGGYTGAPQQNQGYNNNGGYTGAPQQNHGYNNNGGYNGAPQQQPMNNNVYNSNNGYNNTPVSSDGMTGHF